MNKIILILLVLFVANSFAQSAITNINDVRMTFSTVKDISDQQTDQIYEVLQTESEKTGLSAGDVHALMQLFAQYYIRGTDGGDGAFDWARNVIKNNKASALEFESNLKAKKTFSEQEKIMLKIFNNAKNSKGNG